MIINSTFFQPDSSINYLPGIDVRKPQVKINIKINSDFIIRFLFNNILKGENKRIEF